MNKSHSLRFPHRVVLSTVFFCGLLLVSSPLRSQAQINAGTPLDAKSITTIQKKFKETTPTELPSAPLRSGKFDLTHLQLSKTVQSAEKSQLAGNSALSDIMMESNEAILEKHLATVAYIPHSLSMPSGVDVPQASWMEQAPDQSPDEEPLLIPHFEGPGSTHSPLKNTHAHGHNTMPTSFRPMMPLQSAMFSSGFGFRWGRQHQGVDLAAPYGSIIMAAEAGEVIFAGVQSGYGNIVAIDHGHGIVTHYAHCSQMFVSPGQWVKKGQHIAKVGMTGFSTGPHLHFEVVANGVHRDPLKYFRSTLTLSSAH